MAEAKLVSFWQNPSLPVFLAILCIFWSPEMAWTFSSKEGSFGTKSSHFCLKLIYAQPCGAQQRPVFSCRRTLRPGAQAPASWYLCCACLVFKKKILTESFLYLIIWEFCGTCACQLDSSSYRMPCHVHRDPVCHSFWNDTAQMLSISSVCLRETHAQLLPGGW